MRFDPIRLVRARERDGKRVRGDQDLPFAAPVDYRQRRRLRADAQHIVLQLRHTIYRVLIWWGAAREVLRGR